MKKLIGMNDFINGTVSANHTVQFKENPETQQEKSKYFEFMFVNRLTLMETVWVAVTVQTLDLVII